MDSSKIISFIAISILGIVFIAAYFFKSDNWSRSYNPESKEPYGLWGIKELLEDHSEVEFVTEDIEKVLEETEEKTAYVFIGEHYYGAGDSSGIASLTQFIEKGNTGIISCHDGIDVLLDSLRLAHYDTEAYLDETYYDEDYWEENEYTEEKYYENSNYFSEKVVSITLDSFQANVFLRNEYDTTLNTWYYYSEHVNKEGYEELGKVNDKVNFLKIKVGKGYLYVHKTPILFTNYFLRQDELLSYYNYVFKELKHQKYIWDEENRTYHYKNNFSGSKQTSPLRVFLEIENFRWAWYTLLIMFLLIIVFGAKRRQRIIPILKEKKNTSKEFIKTIGSLYFQSGDHAHLGKLKIKLFNQYLYERYGLLLEEQNIEKLAVLSGVDKVLITDINKKQKAVNHLNEVSSDFLIALHVAIEKFIENGK